MQGVDRGARLVAACLPFPPRRGCCDGTIRERIDAATNAQAMNMPNTVHWWRGMALASWLLLVPVWTHAAQLVVQALPVTGAERNPPSLGADWAPVTLPHAAPSTTWYRIFFEIEPREAGSWAIYLPYFYGGGSLVCRNFTKKLDYALTPEGGIIEILYELWSGDTHLGYFNLEFFIR